MAVELTGLVSELAVYTILWLVVHEAFYRLLPIPESVKKLESKEKDRKERDKAFAFYVSYYPALLHAPVTVLISIICLIKYGVSYGQPTQGWESIPIKYSASYFLHDTINGILRGYNDKLFTAHHVLITIVMAYSWYLNMYGSDMCNGITQGEITNPILAVYDVLTSLGYQEAKVRPLGILFLASFIGIRVFIAPYAMWNMQVSDADLFFKLIYTGMWTISMMLIWMMLNKIAKLMNQVA
jgi:hypothetical protein